MADSQQEIDIEALKKTILTWLKLRISEEGFTWLSSTNNQLHKGAEDWEFFSSFSAVPHHVGKVALDLSDEEKEQAQQLRAGWLPGHWSADQLGRTLLLLSIANSDKKDFLERIEKTFISSDTGEAIALYQSLPVLPYPEDLKKRAAEGIRSNITSVFNAVAHYNPFPADYMDEDAWNQVVLKALFVESALYLIQEIDERANKKLAHMLIDYAHERWAAAREVSPELWRCVGPFAKNGMVDDLEKALKKPDKLQQQAAVLALSASSFSGAQQLLKKHATLVEAVKQNGISWDDIGRRANEEN